MSGWREARKGRSVAAAPPPASAAGPPAPAPAPAPPPVVDRPPKRSGWRHLRRIIRIGAVLALVVGVILPIVLIALYRFIEPPTTPLMQLRQAEGLGQRQIWVPLERIPMAIRATAIAAEDGDFCGHSGIDWAALRGAVGRHEGGARLAGASTLTMQLVRSLLLWPGRSFVRKGIELLHAPVADILWGKRRTLELYLNVAEWGPGIYGIEAAAQHWYACSVGELSLEQVARLYAILPNPVAWDPRSEHPDHTARWQRILRRLKAVRIGSDDPCVDPLPPEAWPAVPLAEVVGEGDPDDAAALPPEWPAPGSADPPSADPSGDAVLEPPEPGPLEPDPEGLDPEESDLGESH